MASGKTKDNPARMERDVTIANDRLAGATYRELAKQHHVSIATISRVLNDAEIKDILETGTKQLISMVPLAANNILKDLRIPDKADAQLRALRNKTSDRVLQAGGITPGNVTNQTISNVYNIQNNVTLSPGVSNALFNVGVGDPDIIDIEEGINV